MDKAKVKAVATSPWVGVLVALIGLGTAWVNLQKQKAEVDAKQKVVADDSFSNAKDLLAEQAKLKDTLLAAMLEMAETNRRLAVLDDRVAKLPQVAAVPSPPPVSSPHNTPHPVTVGVSGSGAVAPTPTPVVVTAPPVAANAPFPADMQQRVQALRAVPAIKLRNSALKL